MNKIKAVFFDLDNTLIDFIRLKEESCRSAVDAMIDAGLKMDPEVAYLKLMKKYFELGLESDYAFTEFLKSEGQFNHKILASAINTYLKTKTDFLEPYPNVEMTLEKLKEESVILAIVTDAPKTKAYQRLLAMNLEKYFDFIVGFEDTKQKKKSGLALKSAIIQLKKKMPDIKNDEILMVGDSYSRDLNPAMKLGLKTAVAKYGQIEVEEGKADYLLSEISDILIISNAEAC